MTPSSQTEHHGEVSLNEDIAIWNLNTGNISKIPPLSNTIHSYIFVVKGKLTFKLNNREFTLAQDGFADIMGTTPPEMISSTSDFSGYIVNIDVKFFRNIIKQKPPFPLPYIISCRMNPVVELSRENIAILLSYLNRLNDALRDKDNLFHSEIIEKELSIFILKLANIVCTMGNYIKEETEFNQKKRVMMRFLELLSKNVTKERSVNFYASELCISNQYLARIVKEETGSTVYDCISYFILNEAEILLSRKDHTVQQVAENLNFSDQASFSKFFKKHKGVSPLRFMHGENR